MNYSDKLQQIPADIIRASDYSTLSQSFLSPDILAYINGGAGDENTLNQNVHELEKIQLMPKALVNFSQASTHGKLFGSEQSHPFLLGPVAYQKLVHPEGELATAAAAEAMDTTLILSTLASSTFEEVAHTSHADKWFQLYWQPRREDTLSLIKRAEQAGYRALVFTIDVPVNAMRYREQRAGFVQPQDVQAENLCAFSPAPNISISQNESLILNGIMPTMPDWSDIAWLREQTALPILLKGILNPNDALRAQKEGIDGLVVSNHGGRSLDGFPASLQMLNPIRQAIGPDYPLLLDSGIHHGSDIFKAIALGANAVLIGRLQVHALAVAGALGVAHMLKLLREELEVTMALCGTPTLADIDMSCLLSTNLETGLR